MYPVQADIRVVVPQGALVPRVDIGGIYTLTTTGFYRGSNRRLRFQSLRMESPTQRRCPSLEGPSSGNNGGERVCCECRDPDLRVGKKYGNVPQHDYWNIQSSGCR